MSTSTSSIKMTKAQLVDECIALRHNLNIKDARISDLEVALQRATAPAPASTSTSTSTSPSPLTLLSTYTKGDGTKWGKYRTGYNQCTHIRIA